MARRTSILLLLLVAVAAAPAISAPRPRLVLGTCAEVSGTPGERVCVPVRLETAGLEAASAGFTLAYDAERLSTSTGVLEGGRLVADVEPGPAAPASDVSGFVPGGDEAAIARVRVGILAPRSATVPLLEDGVVARVCFVIAAAAPAGCAPVGFAEGTLDVGSALAEDLEMDASLDGGVLVLGGSTSTTLVSTSTTIPGATSTTILGSTTTTLATTSTTAAPTSTTVVSTSTTSTSTPPSTVASTTTSTTTAPPSTSTTTTLPACVPEDCDDGDACSVDVCDPRAGCQHRRLTLGEALAAPSDASALCGESVLKTVAKKWSAAGKQLAAARQATTAGKAKKAARKTSQAARTLAAALTKANAAVGKGKLSAECAASLATAAERARVGIACAATGAVSGAGGSRSLP